MNVEYGNGSKKTKSRAGPVSRTEVHNQNRTRPKKSGDELFLLRSPLVLVQTGTNGVDKLFVAQLSNLAQELLPFEIVPRETHGFL